MCPHCRAFITTSDRTCPYCGERVGPRAIDVQNPSALLGGFVPHARFVTTMILVVNFGLFAATLLYSLRYGEGGGMLGVDGRTLFEFGGKWRSAVLAGQWWRLVTAGFLHGGLFHILMNSWVLFDLGALVEELYGQARLIAIYFAATVTGFLASTLWSSSLSVGASAGVFGLIGAMIALGTRQRSPMGGLIRGMYIRWAIYGLLLGLLPGLRIDNAAHLGGLAGGYVVAFVAGTPRVGSRLRERLWSLVSYACLLVTGWCFLLLYLWLTQKVWTQ